MIIVRRKTIIDHPKIVKIYYKLRIPTHLSNMVAVTGIDLFYLIRHHQTYTKGTLRK